LSFKGKPVRVIITGDAKEEYTHLNKVVGEEIKKGIKTSEHQTLLQSIKQKIEFLKDNPQYGFHIEKKKIPKEYIKKYEANNLWKANLSGAWRMVYTIKGDEVEIITIILDIFNHKEYNKKFKYKK
jgi:Txe/YoeB family toxin of Txe-Axe toxin-antitoxin module